MPDDRIPPSTYEQDFDTWTLSQAAALRAVGAAMARGEIAADARLLVLDWNNLAEEIESLGRRDRRELGSRLAVIIEYLVKLEFSRHATPRRGWISTIKRERIEIARMIRDSPSLRRRVSDEVREMFETAAEAGLAALEAHGEAVDASGRLARAYTADEVLGDWLPDPPAS